MKKSNIYLIILISVISVLLNQSVFGQRSIIPLCDISVNITSCSQPYTANSRNVYVTITNGNCPWTVSSDATWLTVSGGRSGSGNFTLYCSANSSSNSRTGHITVQMASITKTVTVTQAGVPTPPATPSITNVVYYDGSTKLYAVTPSSGNVRHYWQGTSCSTVSSNYNSTYTVTSSGTYYLRAKDISTNTWSTSCASKTVAVYNKPGTPSSPGITQNDGNTVVYKPSASSGCTMYWQTSSGGTSTSNVASSRTFTSNTTVYLRQRHNTSKLWSTARTVIVNVYHAPATPGIIMGSYFDGYTQLRTIQPLSGTETRYWQGTSCGISKTNANVSYNATSSGRYYLRAFDSETGMWSTCGYKDVTVYNKPATLPVPSITYLNGSTKVYKPSASSGCTVYWQTSSGGTSTSDVASSKTLTSNGTLYLRQKHGASGLWSAARTVSVNVYNNPSMVAVPSISYSHGSTLLTRPSASSGCTVYWQTSSGGTSTNDDASTKTYSSDKTVYIRQRHNTSGLWSTARTVDAKVYYNPPELSTPNINYSDGSSEVIKPVASSGCTVYWQAIYNGTSRLDDASSKTYDTFTRIYIRQRNNTSGLWSPTKTVNVNIYSKPGIPGVPAATINDGNTVLTKPSASSECTVYWQTSSSGTSTDDDITNKTFNSATTIYLRQRHNISGLWSGYKTVNVDVYDAPVTPHIFLKSYHNGSTVINTLQPLSGSETRYWQGTSCGTNMSNSDNDYSVNTSGRYYLRTYDNESGLWSDCAYRDVTVYTTPALVSVPGIEHNNGNSVVTKPSASSGCTVYWQTSSGGTNTTDDAVTKTLDANETLYLRQKHDISGLWSGTITVNVEVYHNPAQPVNPTITHYDGSTNVKLTGKPSDVTYYWQTSTNGTDISNSSVDRTFTSADAGTYYVRAKMNEYPYFWGTQRTVQVDINQLILSPTSLHFNENGGTSPVNISGDCDWELSGFSPIWITIPESGHGNETIDIVCLPNMTYAPRNFTYTIGNQTLEVTQDHKSLNQVSTISGSPTVCENSSVTYSIAPVDGAEEYEWIVPSGWTITSGSNTETISVTIGATDGAVKVRAKNDYDITDYKVLNVDVTRLIQITSYPVDENLCENNINSEFKVQTTGDNMNYKWQIKTPGSSTFVDYTVVPLELHSSILRKPLSLGEDGSQFRCIVSNQCNSITSNPATLTINTLPVIVSQPEDVIVGPFENVQFSVVANNADSYQWQKSEAGSSTFSNIAGENSAVLTISGATEDISYSRYHCVIQRDYCQDLISANAELIVKPEIPIVTITNSNNVLTANVLGKDDPFNFLWSNSSTNSWVDATLPGMFVVKVTDANGDAVTAEYKIDDALSTNYAVNFVKTTNYNIVEGETQSQVNYQFMDGLGRASQTIAVGAGGNNEDIITPVIYDPLGRAQKEYLPYAISGNNGKYNTGAVNNQLSYYFTHSDVNTTAPYSQKIFDKSPLNRVIKQGAPGETWQPLEDDDNDHAVHFSFEVAGNDEVLFFEVDTNNQLIVSGYYEDEKLMKTGTRDENGVWSYEIKNTFGKVLLKVSDPDGLNLKTYYAYDDFGQLRYVLPPLAVDNMGAQTVFDTSHTVIKNLSYYYEYDYRKRMVVKQLPGADPVYMVYDKRDRLILTQDGNMRNSNEWMFTKYDEINRPVMTGIYYHDSKIDQDSMQTIVDNQNAGLYESFHGVIDGINDFGYTRNQSFPVSINNRILTATFYDNYDFDSDHSIQDYMTSIDDANYLVADINFNVIGQVTGVMTRILGSEHFVTAVTMYDHKYRPIRAYVKNPMLKKSDYILTTYDYVGNVLKTWQIHDKDFPNNDLIEIQQRFVYDHAMRLTQEYHKVNDESEVLVAHNVYNDLGQLVQKDFHEIDTNNYLQTIDYKYNIRGWMTRINNPEDMIDDLFAMELFYNDTLPVINESTIPQFNGNIAAIKWQATNNAGNTGIRGYGFSYDGVNRLTSANYGEKPNVWLNSSQYNVPQISYDHNGNILKLKRDGESGAIDNLDYRYTGNQLLAVGDSVDDNPEIHDFIDGSNGYATDEYFYDDNGNMIRDDNKRIDDIDYNFLNLPELVDFGNENWIEFTYDAAGAKLEKKVFKSNALVTHKKYVGGMEYEEDELKLIHTSEGYIEPKASNTFEYNYYLKDHLGNTRICFKDDGNGNTEVLQENHYYPFGMKFAGEVLNNSNKYLYNGKELQDDGFDLDNDGDFDTHLDWYDYGMRYFDPALARFTSIDPLAETYHSHSTYHYALNNPIRYTDFMGMGAKEEGKEESEEEQQQQTKEITENDINKIADNLPEDYTTGDIINAVVGALGDNENAFVKGSTIKKLGNQKAEEAKEDLDPNNPEDKEVIDQIDQGLADGNKVLDQIDKVVKTGNDITVQAKEKDKTIVIEGGINVNIKPDNKITIVDATSSKVQLEMKGISTVAGKIKRATITPQSATVKVGLLPEQTYEF